MGVAPLVLQNGQNWRGLGLTGDETVTIRGLANLRPGQTLDVKITRADGTKLVFPVTCRIDTLDELEYHRRGGILNFVLRQLAA